ncbi:chloramphenicol phosphotransferase CPT family protein [Gluconobacter cerinus]|mgnify:CR=1 FL=1|uniref:chloramphenicol phosphotransferase CPT family protein n=1 Tax=Gluconobacter cerinus TaxID=38307 RepID=UPI001B8BE280|nr:AAA family ATPase [Gluconobacter cerinus]MBS1035938.1 AAA family ATPase [Gluconobacter cerinus]
MSHKPQVIILNGVGSVGKTSTAQALQDIIARSFLHVSMDVFLGMLPKRMFGHPDGMIFETVMDQGAPSAIIHTGKVMARATRGMRHAVAAMTSVGNSVIVDDVMMSSAEGDEYRSLLRHVDLRFVGLHASLEVLEERERMRGDRKIGLARWQFDRVHRGQLYDLELDTTSCAPKQIAQRIAAAFDIRLGD